MGATPAPAALIVPVVVESGEPSAGFVFVSGLGATEADFEGAVWVAGVAVVLLVSSSQSMTSSGTAGVAGLAGVGFVVVVDLGAEATGEALEVDELRLRSASCKRAIRSAFLPV